MLRRVGGAAVRAAVSRPLSGLPNAAFARLRPRPRWRQWRGCGGAVPPLPAPLTPSAPVGCALSHGAGTGGDLSEAVARALEGVGSAADDADGPWFCVLTAAGAGGQSPTEEELRAALPPHLLTRCIGGGCDSPSGDLAFAGVTVVRLPPGSSYRIIMQTTDALPKMPDVPLSELRSGSAQCAIFGIMSTSMVDGEGGQQQPRGPAHMFVERTLLMFPKLNMFAAAPQGSGVPRPLWCYTQADGLVFTQSGMAAVFAHSPGTDCADLVVAAGLRAFAHHAIGGAHIVTTTIQERMFDAPAKGLPTLDSGEDGGVPAPPPAGVYDHPVPVFPLPGCFVFPDALPKPLLRIFEPRYLRLLRRHTEALLSGAVGEWSAGHFVIASVAPDADGEMDGTLCRVTAATSFPNRQAFVRLTGLQRVRVRAEVAARTDFGLRWQRVAPAHDEPEDTNVLMPLLSTVADLRRAVRKDMDEAEAAALVQVPGSRAAAGFAAGGDTAALEAASFAHAAEVIPYVERTKEGHKLVERVFTTRSTTERLKIVAEVLSAMKVTRPPPDAADEVKPPPEASDV